MDIEKLFWIAVAIVAVESILLLISYLVRGNGLLRFTKMFILVSMPILLIFLLVIIMDYYGFSGIGVIIISVIIIMLSITAFLIGYAKKQRKAKVMSIITAIFVLFGSFVTLISEDMIGCGVHTTEPNERLFCDSLLNNYEIYDYNEIDVIFGSNETSYVYSGTWNNRQVYILFTSDYNIEGDDTLIMMTAFDAMSGFVLCFDYTFESMYIDYYTPGAVTPENDIYPTITNLGIDKYYETGELKIIPSLEKLSERLHECFVRAVDIFKNYGTIDSNQYPVIINEDNLNSIYCLDVDYIYNGIRYNKVVYFNIYEYNNDISIEYDHNELGSTISYSIYQIIEDRIDLEKNRIVYYDGDGYGGFLRLD